MRTAALRSGDYKMKHRYIRTVVVGSGCAGFNAADSLSVLGETDIALVTEDILAGTSRNTGSDKQTYYKLSLAGDDGDSVGELAKTLKKDDVNGDTALCEATYSTRCFYKLVSLGVPFPVNEYGEYAGYQTDHDVRRRATSAGPLTSRFMTEALEKSVNQRNIEILNHLLAFRVETDEQGVKGLLCYDTENKEFLVIHCASVVLCTGGPAGLYRDCVYPVSQFGMSGMAMEAGAEGANLDCWQYGLASVKFRWNLSGSYQQVLPRYVSVDENGIEYEFLNKALGNQTALYYTFLKGYQWPFDPKKVDGSSKVDLLVKAETDKGRRVYLDYTHNPTGFEFESLPKEAHDYLVSCGATGTTPIERLRAMNAPAIELYRDHGIDLTKELLEIRVCAQHHNGGIAVDEHWQTCVKGLYVCGEAAGTFGHARPGGTALNSTQVGSLRAAEHIAKEKREISDCTNIEIPKVPLGDVQALTSELQSEMSRSAAFIRNESGMRKLLDRMNEILENSMEASANDTQLVERLRLRDLCLIGREVLSAMLYGYHNGILYTRNGISRDETARPIPERDLWFERVWKKYREETGQIK